MSTIATDADVISDLLVDTLCGELQLGVSQGMKLASVFKRYNAAPSAIQQSIVLLFATKLTTRDRDLAESLQATIARALDATVRIAR